MPKDIEWKGNIHDITFIGTMSEFLDAMTGQKEDDKELNTLLAEEERKHPVDSQSYDKGWLDAREYYKQAVTTMVTDWGMNEGFEEDDIEEAFSLPEDELSTLRNAALNSKGQP